MKNKIKTIIAPRTLKPGEVVFKTASEKPERNAEAIQILTEAHRELETAFNQWRDAKNVLRYILNKHGTNLHYFDEEYPLHPSHSDLFGEVEEFLKFIEGDIGRINLGKKSLLVKDDVALSPKECHTNSKDGDE